MAAMKQPTKRLAPPKGPLQNCPYQPLGCTFQGTEPDVDDHVLYMATHRDDEHDPYRLNAAMYRNGALPRTPA